MNGNVLMRQYLPIPLAFPLVLFYSSLPVEDRNCSGTVSFPSSLLGAKFTALGYRVHTSWIFSEYPALPPSIPPYKGGKNMDWLPPLYKGRVGVR